MADKIPLIVSFTKYGKVVTSRSNLTFLAFFLFNTKVEYYL